MSPFSSTSPAREWFAVDTLPSSDDETAWLPALDSRWETVGGLILTVTDHSQSNTSVDIQVTIENQRQRQTRFRQIDFAHAVERGLFSRIEHGHETGERPLSPQANERQVAIRQLCHRLNDHDMVSCARIEDEDHHILLAFDIDRTDESTTVPDEIHTLLTDEQFVPLFDTAPDESVSGSLEYTRDSWAHHRYVAVEETDSSDATPDTDTESITGRIAIEIDAGGIIGAYTGLPAPVNPSIPLVTAFELPSEHEQDLCEALTQCDVGGHDVDLTIRSRRTVRRNSGGGYTEVVVTPAFSVTTLCDTIAEHISDLGGTVYLRGDEMELIYDSSLTYAVRVVPEPSSRSQLVESVLTVLPEPVKAVVQRWRPGATFTADVAGIRLQTDRNDPSRTI